MEKVIERAWAVVLVGGPVLLVILLAFIAGHNNPASDSSKQRDSDDDVRERYVQQDSIAGASIEDMAFVSKAWRTKDYDGIAALLRSDRIFEISKGTKVRANCQNGIANVRIESGSLIGRMLFMNCDMLSK